MSNNYNSDRAHNALEALATVKDSGNQDDRENTVDLLTNLMHLCAGNGEGFEGCLASARMHFEAEVEDELERLGDAAIMDADGKAEAGAAS